MMLVTTTLNLQPALRLCAPGRAVPRRRCRPAPPRAALGKGTRGRCGVVARPCSAAPSQCHVCVQLLASCFVAWWCPPESCPWLSVCPVHLGAPSCTPISTWKNPQCKRQLKKSPSPAAPCPQSAVSPSLNGALELQQVSLCLPGPSLSTLLRSPCSLWLQCSAMGDAGGR